MALFADAVHAIDDLTHALAQYENENYQFRKNNSELREALLMAWRCVHAGISCSDCRLIAGGCTLQTAMEGLGVEPK